MLFIFPKLIKMSPKYYKEITVEIKLSEDLSNHILSMVGLLIRHDMPL